MQGALRDLSLDQAGTSSIPPVAHGLPPSQPVAPPPPSAQRHSRFGSISRHGSARRDSNAPSAFQPELDPQDHLIDLTGASVPRLDLDGFRPVAAFKFSSPMSASGGAARSCLALSNVGFLAASNEASLIVVDLRGPEVLLVDVPAMGEPSKKGEGGADASAITALTWTICAIGEGALSPSQLICRPC